MRPVADMLMERCTRESEDSCWEWSGYRDRDGYGLLKLDKRQQRAHRLAHLEWIGPLDPGQIVLHSCDNPSCINPRHLRAGSHMDNAQDRMVKDRSVHGARHPLAKLSASDVAEIHRRTALGESGISIARSFGISNVTCCRIRRGVVWERSKRGS